MGPGFGTCLGTQCLMAAWRARNLRQGLEALCLHNSLDTVVWSGPQRPKPPCEWEFQELLRRDERSPQVAQVTSAQEKAAQVKASDSQGGRAHGTLLEELMWTGSHGHLAVLDRALDPGVSLGMYQPLTLLDHCCIGRHLCPPASAHRCLCHLWVYRLASDSGNCTKHAEPPVDWELCWVAQRPKSDAFLQEGRTHQTAIASGGLGAYPQR
mmetsp:Transcript_1431/g.3906  ORF Transcript_1431/g.3906 Transcript_1431/m.3906 type:complete len:211 (-) Transcript_1431:221-853(-)